MVANNKLEFNPVLVEWVDSVQTSGWTDTPTVSTNCVTVGMLVDNKDKGSITLALNKSHYGHGQYVTIPLVAITKVTKLKK